MLNEEDFTRKVALKVTTKAYARKRIHVLEQKIVLLRRRLELWAEIIVSEDENLEK